MKTDLASSIVTAVVCIVIGYFLCNVFLPAVENVSFKTLSGDNNYSLTEPDVEVFNYRAINPTVEVYVGGCTEYNENGDCVDDISSVETDDDLLSEDVFNDSESVSGNGGE